VCGSSALGLPIRKYHLNEGHAALSHLGVAATPSATIRGEAGSAGFTTMCRPCAQRCVFTTHTPVRSGARPFPYELADRLLGDFIDRAELRRLAGGERLNMTRLALNLSEARERRGAPSCEVSRRMFPGYEVHAITTACTRGPGLATAFAGSMTRICHAGCHEPELLVRADRIPDDELLHAHAEAKGALLDRIRRFGASLDAALPVLGFCSAHDALQARRPAVLGH